MLRRTNSEGVTIFSATLQSRALLCVDGGRAHEDSCARCHDRSESLFRLVGQIDRELYETDSSGYTQYGRAFLSLQSAVPDARFIAGYVRAAMVAQLEYGTIVNSRPALFQGGAAFPGNDWILNRRGEEYLSRIPSQSHAALRDLRDYHLRITGEVLRRIDRRESNVVSFECS